MLRDSDGSMIMGAGYVQVEWCFVNGKRQTRCSLVITKRRDMKEHERHQTLKHAIGYKYTVMVKVVKVVWQWVRVV